MTDGQPTKPTDVSEHRGRFDSLADRASTGAAKPGFFLVVLAGVVLWLVLGPLTGFSHGWVDGLQVVAAVVTLLMVALLENEQWRNGKATQRKLNAVAEALAHLMESQDRDREHIEQLRAAVGLEKRESITE